MNPENQNSKQTYIQLLADTLKRKIDVLKQLKNFTQNQEAEINSPAFSEDSFMQLISLKDEQIKKLSQLDDGFEQLYQNVKEELDVHRESYAAYISKLQELISEITDLSVELQTMETRNKAKLETLLASKRKSIRQAKISTQTASNYYKTMAMQQETQSYFYDRKK